jgi:hypothetical protein
VTQGLDAASVAYDRAPALVRGLDYYRHTAFEFVTDRLGAQGTVLGGGRYDGLMESAGRPFTPLRSAGRRGSSGWRCWWGKSDQPNQQLRYCLNRMILKLKLPLSLANCGAMALTAGLHFVRTR